MRINKFSQITAQLPYPARVKGKLQSIHSTIITSALTKSSLTRAEANQIIKVINIVTLRCINDEELGWRDEEPLSIDGNIDDDELQNLLDDLYVIPKYIDWSLDDVDLIANTSIFPKILSNVKPMQTSAPSLPQVTTTSKEALYIQPPVIPQFDTTKIYASGQIDGCSYVIYKSLPIIPTTQNEISATTDVDMMSQVDLLRLFPKQRVNTRAASLYESVPTLSRHPILGNIIPIEGYTDEQIIDNIVKYPHLYKLVKQVGSELVSFYTSIEIDGELRNISDIWKDLPESNVIPYQKDYIKEYVVRRYLLERDIKGVQHKFPMYGDLYPFLTLFTTIDEYVSLGYKDVESIAMQCVKSRVAYKRSRNPVLRRLNNV